MSTSPRRSGNRGAEIVHLQTPNPRNKASQHVTSTVDPCDPLPLTVPFRMAPDTTRGGSFTSGGVVQDSSNAKDSIATAIASSSSSSFPTRHHAPPPASSSPLSPPYSPRERRAWADVQKSLPLAQPPSSPAYGAAPVVPPRPSSSPRSRGSPHRSAAANGPWLWAAMKLIDEGMPSLQSRFHRAYGSSGGGKGGGGDGKWDLRGVTPMTREEFLAAEAAGREGQSQRERTQPAGPTQAMLLAAERRQHAESANQRREEARRKAFAKPEPVPDAVWEGRVGETLRGIPRKKVRQVFDSFDADGSGQLDAGEFTKGVQMLGLSELPDDVGLRLFQKHDVQGDGLLEREELIALLSAVREAQPRLNSNQQRKLAALQWVDPNDLFATYDLNSDGVISAAELAEGLGRQGIPSAMAELVVSDMDADRINGDRIITKTEWARSFYTSRICTCRLPAGEAFADLTSGLPGCEDIELVEHRGLTLRQLEDLLFHIRRRCAPEGWVDMAGSSLQANDVTLLEAARYVVRPATILRQCSYVELVARGVQKPRWFVSLWSGTAMADVLSCLSMHSYDRGLERNEDPYWMCNLAANLWRPTEGSDVSNSFEETPFKKPVWPTDSAFYRAMQSCDGTVAILDPHGSFFRRLWCVFEAHLVFTRMVCSMLATRLLALACPLCLLQLPPPPPTP